MEDQKRHIHWLAPVSMLAAFIAGILLALGHHLFYRGLNGKETPTDDYHVGHLHYSKQQMNIQVGTAFAFLVKAFLVVSISIAYAQVFWNAFASSHQRKLPTLKKIDTAFSALGNLLTLFNIPVWLWNPTLISIATLTWLLPIASIITPGTLSVQALMLNQSSLLPVPFLNFTSLSFTDRLINSGDGNVITFDYNGPSQIVQTIAKAVSAQGSILSITPPSSNSSWQVQFYGPYLKCNTMDDVHRGRVLDNIANYFSQIGPDNYDSPVCTQGRYLYLSWFQGVPFSNQSSNYSISTASLTSNIGGNATISIATLPGMLDVNNPCADFPTSQSPVGDIQNTSFVNPNKSIADQNPLGTVGEGAAMLQCQLFNSTYKVDFEYVNGNQSITIDAPGKSSDIPFKTFNYVGQKIGHIVIQNQSETISYDAGIRCFAFQLATNLGSFPDPCDFDPALFRTIAYQGVMDAFANLLYGTIAVPYFGALPKNTSILGTTLVNTNELDFLNDQSSNYLDGFGNGQDFQQAVWDVGLPINGIAQVNTSRRNQSLTRAIEELFQNYTISLMSSNLLQPNVSQQEMQLANVTTTVFQNVYAYSSDKLWLAYGIAILLTAVSIFQGLFVIYSSGASYSNNFSTVMRSTWSAELSVDYNQASGDCRDPLPDILAKATVELPATARRRSSRSRLTENKSGTGTVYTKVASVPNDVDGH